MQKKWVFLPRLIRRTDEFHTTHASGAHIRAVSRSQWSPCNPSSRRHPCANMKERQKKWATSQIFSRFSSRQMDKNLKWTGSSTRWQSRRKIFPMLLLAPLKQVSHHAAHRKQGLISFRNHRAVTIQHQQVHRYQLARGCRQETPNRILSTWRTSKRGHSGPIQCVSCNKQHHLELWGRTSSSNRRILKLEHQTLVSSKQRASLASSPQSTIASTISAAE